MELDLRELGLTDTLRGRKKLELTAEVVGELEAADLVLLSEERGIKPQGLKRLTTRHHALARGLASGLSDPDVAHINGYTPSRVSVLKGDPAFKELVEHYKKNVEAEYLDMHDQLAGLSQDAIQELRGRLEDAPADFSKQMLLDIVTKGADRVGHGPSTTTNTNVNVNIAERLGNARKRIAAAKELIDITPEKVDAESG